MNIDFMCLVVEAYIFKMKGVQVRINRDMDQRQYNMLMHAFQIATSGN